MEYEPAEDEMFATPEEAALSGWVGTPSAHARVVAVELNGDRATVSIQTDGHPGFHDLDVVECERTADGRWIEGSSYGWNSS